MKLRVKIKGDASVYPVEVIDWLHLRAVEITLISELTIKKDTKEALHRLGYTETGNFIESDDIILAKNLTKGQYADLASAIARIKAGMFWEEQRQVEAAPAASTPDKEITIADVARWFNLPPHKLKDLTTLSLNKTER